MKRTEPLFSVTAGNTLFGAAAARTRLPIRELEHIFDLPGEYDALELPMEVLELPDLPFRLSEVRKRFRTVHAGAILNRSVSVNLPRLPDTLKKSFLSFLEYAITQLTSNGISYAELNIDANNLLNNPELLKGAVKILRTAAPLLCDSGITLLIPYLLPPRGGETSSAMAKLLADTLCPNIKLRLDLYPGELPRGCDPNEIAGPLLTEIKSVMFVCNTDAGVRLGTEDVAPWIEKLAVMGYTGPYFAAPQSSGGSSFFPELDEFATHIRAMRAQ